RQQMADRHARVEAEPREVGAVARVAVGDPQVAHQRESEAAAHGVSVHRGDRRHRQVEDPQERRARGGEGPARSAPPPPARAAPRKWAPAQKLEPRPVTTTARSSGSERARPTHSRNAAMTSGVMLLRFSGRSSVSVAIPPSTSYDTAASPMARSGSMGKEDLP